MRNPTIPGELDEQTALTLRSEPTRLIEFPRGYKTLRITRKPILLSVYHGPCHLMLVPAPRLAE